MCHVGLIENKTLKKGEKMDTLTSVIEKELKLPENLQIQLFKTIFIIIFMALMYNGIKKILYKTIEDTKIYYKTKKTVGYVFVFIGFIMAGRVWFMGVKSLTTFLGLLSAGLAIAMKDFIMNIAGWFYLIWKRPFKVGDRIEILEIAGDVIDIQLFEFALLETRKWVNADQSTGRIVYVPNSIVLNNPIFNYSGGIPYIWNEIPIHITYESNWKKAKEILLKIAKIYGKSIGQKAGESIKEASQKFMIFNSKAKLEPVVYTSIDNENSITLTIRYMSSYRNRRGTSEKIYEAILEEFENHEDIEFAYPTYRVYRSKDL